MNPNLWNLSVNQDDHLALGGGDLVALAQRHGTPLHVVDDAALRANYRNFAGTFERHHPESRVYFSYKTNCVPGLLRRLHEEGCGAEVISPYELWLAQRVGVDPKNIVFNGVAKSPDVLRLAVESEVGLINIDSELEADQIIQIASDAKKPVSVGIRVDPGVGWRGQFGIESNADAVLNVCRKLKACEFTRLHCLAAHVSSGLRQAEMHQKTARVLCRLARHIRESVGTEIEALDVGGGFAVPTVKTLSMAEVALYKFLNRPPRPPRPELCPSIDDFARSICETLRQESGDAGTRPPALLLEPGRALSSSAQVLLVRVQDIKERRNGRRYAITDGGMQTIALPLSSEYHHCFVANRATATRSRRYFVTGPLCSPEDILYRNWPLPELSCGDVLAILDAGAYFTSFANSFSFPRPPVALVSDGESQILRRGESYEHMTALDEEMDSKVRG